MKKVDDYDEQSDEFFKEVETAFLWVSKAIAIVLCVIGFSLIVFQVWEYFINSTWQPISIISMLVYFKFEWAVSPSSFHVVYKILDFIPLSLFFFVMALIQYLSGLAFMKKFLEALRNNRSDKYKRRFRK